MVVFLIIGIAMIRASPMTPFSTGETYRDVGADYFTRRDPNARPDA